MANQVDDSSQQRPAYWGAVFAMTLCVFALIASEFMPVSLLTPIAGDLRVSQGWAGYGIAISGAFAVITSLSITSLVSTMNRKTLLLLLTGLMCLSGAVIGLAPNYITYMIGRALIGVVIGGFWSMSAAVAMRLVPIRSVPKALAIFNGGNALATVVAAPFGSYLGGVIGWRGAFFCLVPIALIALAWQWISLPSIEAVPRKAGRNTVFGLLKTPLVAFGMLGVGTFFTGQFILFTYVRPFLETVTQVDISTLSIILLVIGIAGFIGTILIGALLKFGLYRILILIPVVMSIIAVGLIIFGNGLAMAFILLGLWGLMATAAPVGWWSWLALSLPKDAEAGGGLMVAVIQLSIALGSTIGGILYDGRGYSTTFVTSAVVLLIAACLAFFAYKASLRH
ncbi:MFS transporter [uncultured Bartonella sp.]|uniref:MFS transporter n=1 Tax=uncultured Bartonella sp. TaxID=104108 RepID=UPI0025DB64BB|nr:MFS transporter [uncultured Bartonella sp.]MCT6871758.1 MFS transporter [Bartonella sp.]